MTASDLYLGDQEDQLPSSREWPVTPFSEIERVERVFELFELSHGRVGSGRQTGDRNEMWGSIAVLARSALEQAIRRLHEDVCTDSTCKFDKVNFHDHNFFEVLDRHSSGRFTAIPDSLHLRVRRKKASNAGSGVDTNGPVSKEDFQEALKALNWVRNGFDHHNHRKTERLPEERFGEGVYWVAGKNDVWTMQKPHAFSVIRLCHLLYRLVVFEWWGEDAANACRSMPVTYVADTHAPALSAADIVDQMGEALHKGSSNEALALVQPLQRSILGKADRAPQAEALFSGQSFDFTGPLSEPLVNRRSLPSSAITPPDPLPWDA